MSSTAPFARYMFRLAVASIAAMTMWLASVPCQAEDVIPWVPDLGHAQQIAAARGQLVLIHFWTESCPPCKRVEANVFSKPRLAQHMTQYFVPVKINAELAPQVARRFGVERWPTDVVIAPNGELLTRVVGVPQEEEQYGRMLTDIAMRFGRPSQQDVATAPPSIPTGPTPPPVAQNEVRSQSSRWEDNNDNPMPPGVTLPVAHNSLEVDDQSAEIVNRYVTESNQAVQQVREAGQDMANRFATEAHRAIDNRFGADGSDSRWGNDAEPSPSTPPSLTLSAPQQSSAAPSMGMARDRSIAPGDPRTDPSNESPPPAETENSSFAMDGYCPVALMEHRKWVRGDRRWGAVHRGRTYLFHSVEAQQAFLNRPDFYAPVLSCYDPVTYVEQQAFITGARQFGVVYDPTAAAAAGTNNQNARIFLFQSEETLTRFWNDPGRYAEAVHEAIRIADSQTR